MPRGVHFAQLDHQAERLVYGSVAAEGPADIGIQENEVGPGVIALRVLAAHAALEQLAEIPLKLRTPIVSN